MTKATIFLLGVMSTSAFAGPVPSEWTNRYKAEVKLITARDFVGWQKLIAKEFVWVQPDGKKVNRKDAIAEYKGLFDALKIEGDSVPKRVVQRGQKFDVTYAADFLITFAGQGRKRYTESGVDTWKRIAGKWQIIKNITKKMSMTEAK
jgi:hypothetical protein